MPGNSFIQPALRHFAVKLLFHFRFKNQGSQITENQCTGYSDRTRLKTTGKDTNKAIFIYRILYPFPERISKAAKRNSGPGTGKVNQGFIPAECPQQCAYDNQSDHDPPRHQLCFVNKNLCK